MCIFRLQFKADFSASFTIRPLQFYVFRSHFFHLRNAVQLVVDISAFYYCNAFIHTADYIRKKKMLSAYHKIKGFPQQNLLFSNQKYTRNKLKIAFYVFLPHTYTQKSLLANINDAHTHTHMLKHIFYPMLKLLLFRIQIFLYVSFLLLFFQVIIFPTRKECQSNFGQLLKKMNRFCMEIKFFFFYFCNSFGCTETHRDEQKKCK